jgi:hypothetical protein
MYKIGEHKIGGVGIQLNLEIILLKPKYRYGMNNGTSDSKSTNYTIFPFSEFLW